MNHTSQAPRFLADGSDDRHTDKAGFTGGEDGCFVEHRFRRHWAVRLVPLGNDLGILPLVSR